MFLNEYLKELFRVNNIYLKEIYIDAMLLNKNKKKEFIVIHVLMKIL